MATGLWMTVVSESSRLTVTYTGAGTTAADEDAADTSRPAWDGGNG